MSLGERIDDQMRQRLTGGAVAVSMVMALILGIYMCSKERREDVVKARDMPTLNEQVKATEKFMAGVSNEPEIVFDKDGVKIYKVAVPGHGVLFMAWRSSGGLALSR